MYFVLEGTTEDVKYQQYRQAVIAGFEQSAEIKESLRKYLVDHFGYFLRQGMPLLYHFWPDLRQCAAI